MINHIVSTNPKSNLNKMHLNIQLYRVLYCYSRLLNIVKRCNILYYKRSFSIYLEHLYQPSENTMCQAWPKQLEHYGL